MSYDYSQFDPGFGTSLEALLLAAAEAGHNVNVNSGFRSVERQRQLWDQALKKYGDPAIARKWVAPPGRSYHGKGLAADLGYANDAAREWIHSNASTYGLGFPLSNENWHIEPVSARAQANASSATVPQQQSQGQPRMSSRFDFNTIENEAERAALQRLELIKNGLRPAEVDPWEMLLGAGLGILAQPGGYGSPLQAIAAGAAQGIGGMQPEQLSIKDELELQGQLLEIEADIEQKRELRKLFSQMTPEEELRYRTAMGDKVAAAELQYRYPEQEPATVTNFSGTPYIVHDDGSVTPAPGFVAPPKEESRTTAQKNYDALIELGASPEEAQERAFSGGVNVNVGNATESERRAEVFRRRMSDASTALSEIEDPGQTGGGIDKLKAKYGPNWMQSPETQQYRTQAQVWARNKLRLESGAQISEQEARDEMMLYFPQPGDSEETIKAKRAARRQAEESLLIQAGRAAPSPGSSAAPSPGSSPAPSTKTEAVTLPDGQKATVTIER